MKYTILITAWNEPGTVQLNLENILKPEAKNLLEDMEIILVCPDEETKLAAQLTVQTLGFANYRHIYDQRMGKPTALNLGIKNSYGQIIIAMDGDIAIGKNTLPPLVEYFENEQVGGVSGRPVSIDTKDKMLGYWGNLLAEAAHVKRMDVSNKGFSYFMSGYLCAFRKIDGMEIPANILSDDAWMSLELLNLGYKIAYSPNSLVYVKYPKNIKDWFKQKRRSAGGYSQLADFYKKKDLNLPKRNIIEEIKYFFFPLRYSRDVKQFFYSLALYPTRLLLWLLIKYDKLKGNQKTGKLWVRIESTKN